MAKVKSGFNTTIKHNSGHAKCSVVKGKIKKKKHKKAMEKHMKKHWKKNKVSHNQEKSQDSLHAKSSEKSHSPLDTTGITNSTQTTSHRPKTSHSHHRKTCMKHKKEKKERKKGTEKEYLEKVQPGEGSYSNSQQKSEKLHWKKKKNKQKRTDEKEASRNHNSSTTNGVSKQTPRPLRPDIWFDDVDMDLIEQVEGKVNPVAKVARISNPLVKERDFDGLTKAVAMDCEMVGVGTDGSDSILARVSIVNMHGKCVYDKYVKPTEKVTDYRTQVSGIRRKDIHKATDFQTVQKEVCDIIKNRILVGHAIRNDLQVLYLDHPHKMIRDTMRYRPFRACVNGRNPSLKKLAAEVLGVEVQKGEHSSVQDAQAAMRLYTMHKRKWEEELSKKFTKPSTMKFKKSKKTVNINKYTVDLDDSD